MQPDRFEHRRIQREVEARRERDSTQHPYRILDEPHFRIADRSHDAGPKILHAVHVVDDREGRDIVDERVDREVAPEGVLFGRAEGIVAVEQLLARMRRWVGYRHAFLDDFFAGLNLAAERRHLDHLRAELDVSQTESASDDPAVPEQLLDLVGMGRRADVKILGAAAEQQVAHASADEVSDVIELPEAIENFEGIGVDIAARDRMLCARDLPRFDHGGIVPKPSVPAN